MKNKKNYRGRKTAHWPAPEEFYHVVHCKAINRNGCAATPERLAGKFIANSCWRPAAHDADYAEKNTDGRGFALTGREVMRLAMATAGEEGIWVPESEATGGRGSMVGGGFQKS